MACSGRSDSRARRLARGEWVKSPFVCFPRHYFSPALYHLNAWNSLSRRRLNIISWALSFIIIIITIIKEVRSYTIRNITASLMEKATWNINMFAIDCFAFAARPIRIFFILFLFKAKKAILFSKIQLGVYYQCCVLIGWATTRLFIAH